MVVVIVLPDIRNGSSNSSSSSTAGFLVDIVTPTQPIPWILTSIAGLLALAVLCVIWYHCKKRQKRPAASLHTPHPPPTPPPTALPVQVCIGLNEDPNETMLPSW